MTSELVSESPDRAEGPALEDAGMPEKKVTSKGFSFQNMKVGKKIGFGFGLVMVCMMAVAIESFLGLTDANTNFKDYRSIARQTNQMGRIQANLLTARLGVKDYILKGSEKAADAVNTRIDTLVNLIEEAKGLVKSPDHIKAIDQAASQIAIYNKNFDRVIDFRAKRNAEVDKMNTFGPQSERSLTKIMRSAFEDNDPQASFLAGQTLRHLLLARLYSNRFLVDNAKSSADRANQELNDFAKNAEQMKAELQNPTRQQLAAEVLTLAQQYKTAFTSVTAIIFERNSVISGTLDKIGPQIANSMEQIKLQNKAEQDRLGPDAEAANETYVLIMEIVAAAALIIGVIMAYIIGRAISRPVIAMTGSMNELASGNLSTEIPAIGRTDEIGQMADAVQVFKDNAIEVDRLQKERAEQERLAEEKKRQDMQKLADDFETSVSEVVKTVSAAATELQSTAQQMTATADQTKDQAGHVGTASESASGNVQTVAAAAEELSASISEISRQISDSNTISQQAVGDAEVTNESVQGLATAAQKIGDVVSLIQDIAEQTNLLALNATIEAARAGEAGKGFAVVASEVKSLANQTANATEEISNQITEMQQATEGTVASIEKITDVINQISGNATTIASAIEQQNASTQEISRNVQQASQGTREVADNIGTVSQGAEETGTAAGQVLESAGELSQQSELLRSKVESFISELRAA